MLNILSSDWVDIADVERDESFPSIELDVWKTKGLNWDDLLENWWNWDSNENCELISLRLIWSRFILP